MTRARGAMQSRRRELIDRPFGATGG